MLAKSRHRQAAQARHQCDRDPQPAQRVERGVLGLGFVAAGGDDHKIGAASRQQAKQLIVGERCGMAWRDRTDQGVAQCRIGSECRLGRRHLARDRHDQGSERP